MKFIFFWKLFLPGVPWQVLFKALSAILGPTHSLSDPACSDQIVQTTETRTNCVFQRQNGPIQQHIEPFLRCNRSSGSACIFVNGKGISPKGTVEYTAVLVRTEPATIHFYETA